MQENDTLLQKFLSKYLPYWPLFVLAAVLAMLSAWLYLKFSPSVYEATATLIIKDEKKGTEESKIAESFNLISAKKIVENEIEVIQSRTLMQRVAISLNLNTPIIEKRNLIRKSAYFSAPVSIKTIHPEAIKTSLNIPLTFSANTGEVVLDGKYRYPIEKEVETPYGELLFKKNTHYIPDEDNHKFYLSVYRLQELVPALLKNFKAEPAGKLSSIVNLSYRDEVPERAETVLNALIQIYRQSEIDDKNILAKNTLEFVNERLAIVANDLDSILHQVQLYKSDKGAVDISKQGQLYLTNVSENDQKLSEINTQLSVLTQLENFVKDSDNRETVTPSTLGLNDPLLTRLLDQLNLLELEYEKGKVTIGENNPRLLEIRDQVNKLKPNILKNINSQQKSLLAIRENIYATNRSYNSMLEKVPQKERSLIDISREEQNKRNIYNFLLEKKEESEIAYASTVSNNRIVDEAEAGDKPIFPKKIMVYATALVFFTGLFMMLITLRESLKSKIMYRREIEECTLVPIIGEIASNEKKQSIVIETGRRNFIAEEFRKLRLSLSFPGIDDTHKKILVTSHLSGEGKSFVASNLAVSLALTGLKVILADLDLNHPSQDKIFKTDNRLGVSSFLEKKVTLAEIISPVSGYDNLSLITSGPLPENPTELIMNRRVEILLKNLETEFDIVIVDTSPVGLVTDGYALTKLCDATLFIVRHNYTPKVLLRRLDQNNKINPIHNPAIVFNGVKQKGFFASTRGYGYGYDYVYGHKKYRKQVSA